MQEQVRAAWGEKRSPSESRFPSGPSNKIGSGNTRFFRAEGLQALGMAVFTAGQGAFPSFVGKVILKSLLQVLELTPDAEPPKTAGNLLFVKVSSCCRCSL